MCSQLLESLGLHHETFAISSSGEGVVVTNARLVVIAAVVWLN